MIYWRRELVEAGAVLLIGAFIIGVFAAGVLVERNYQGGQNEVVAHDYGGHEHSVLVEYSCCPACPAVAPTLAATPTPSLCERGELPPTAAPESTPTIPPPRATATPEPTDRTRPTETREPEVTPTMVEPTSTMEPTNVPSPSPEPTEKMSCNKGGGNGPEGCDPGNNPGKGHDDEDQEHPHEGGHGYNHGLRRVI